MSIWKVIETLISMLAPKPMRNSLRSSLEKTLWKVCLKRDVLNESPITMWPLRHVQHITCDLYHTHNTSHVISITRTTHHTWSLWHVQHITCDLCHTYNTSHVISVTCTTHDMWPLSHVQHITCDLCHTHNTSHVISVTRTTHHTWPLSHVLHIMCPLSHVQHTTRDLCHTYNASNVISVIQHISTSSGSSHADAGNIQPVRAWTSKTRRERGLSAVKLLYLQYLARHPSRQLARDMRWSW